VEQYKLEGKERVAAKEGYLDDKKVGIAYSSPMKKGTFELNKNYDSLHTGDLYQVLWCRYCLAFYWLLLRNQHHDLFPCIARSLEKSSARTNSRPSQNGWTTKKQASGTATPAEKVRLQATDMGASRKQILRCVYLAVTLLSHGDVPATLTFILPLSVSKFVFESTKAPFYRIMRLPPCSSSTSTSFFFLFAFDPMF
jgi:hypothetical protein